MGAVALSGCSLDKPTPIVTLVSGSDSVHSEAECYDSKGLAAEKAQECLSKENFTTISAVRGTSYRIGVDGKIADNGWTVLINGSPADAQFHKTTYVSPLSIPYASTDDESNSIMVHIIEQKDPQAPIKGVWAFKVDKKNP